MTQTIEKSVILTNDKASFNLLLSLIDNGARFISFTYRAKGDNSLARYVLQIVNFRKVYNDDLLALELMDKKAFNETKAQAFKEVKESLEKSLELGLGNNPEYTRKNTDCKVGIFTLTSKGLNVKGLVKSKVVLEKGEDKKPVNSSLKTIYKNEIRKELKISKIREFCLDNVKIARLNGETIELE